jgi:hypothetical protein
MRCHDKTLYPICDASFNKIFGNTQASLSINHLIGLYKQLIDVAEEIPYKILINYPTERLDNENWKKRIDDIQSKASDLFPKNGWYVVHPELEPNLKDPYWAHYSNESRAKLWQTIEDIQKG